jgi:hypothetical protein
MLSSMGAIFDTTVLETYESIKVLLETRENQYYTTCTTYVIWSIIMTSDKDSQVNGLVGQTMIEALYFLARV